MSAAAEDRRDDRDDREEQYAFPVPPPGGWTADDLDRIKGLPPHTELIDGGLFFVTPQTDFHMAALRLLENELVRQAPDDLYVVREMTTKLGERDRPEPDLMVVPWRARTGPEQTWYAPDDILLAVEIVSDESVQRDRELKPRKYAAAGIRHFWRVEKNDGLPVVYVYELDPATRSYAVTGIHHNRLKVDVPCPVEIDLTAVERRRGTRD
ncbi:Uma2 family endonuclease [Streptomyces sp. ICN441]|uniref:Uma2 family endonuclease n=1 Tax=Streptomyces tirandamycinicus TaxID=2174846 RepID=A0A2S1T399_9ACTN|nr:MULTISPECIES: Uma2 family endonuclease [Streptomyces]AWI33007.1 Uma2 family endonuclease [Streptomyces tirandamycinicus]NNJ08319.1 Uma2 family endonuclease [Streptomyces sp. PKU-MA01144]TFE50228.1 Uma2 family endonuclease [Streptomyces sp. ICN441]